MTQTISPLTVTLRMDTRLSTAFIKLITLPILLGWRPGPKTQDRLANIAAKLIRVRAE